MSTARSEALTRNPSEDWRLNYEGTRWEHRSRRSGSGLLLAGLAVVGLGALAWYYLGPDLRRYLKIRNM
jgi:hypothetical protein